MIQGPSVWRRLGWRLEALGYDALAILLRALPVDWASWVGGAVVQVLGPLTPKQRIVLRNLELAFPEKPYAERRALARAFWNSLGRTVAEFPLMDRLTPARGRVEVVGAEHLTPLIASGQAGVLVSGHLSNWEVMMAGILSTGLKSHVSYRPANNPHVDRRIVESRRRYGVELFAPKGGNGTRELLAALGRGESVALLNDQRDNAGVEAPFFGRMVRTAPGPSRFALKFGRRLYPCSVARLKGARFRMTFHAPIEVAVSGDREADLTAAVAQVNRFIEARVRERPAEWLWAHRRWPLQCYEDLAPPAAARSGAASESSLRRQGPA